MTLQQTLQASTGKAKELFDKLEETSDQAVKTRENLFADLSRELRLHAEIEQKHLFPALRNSDDTKELVPDAARTNKELRTKVDELEALPKGSNEFLPRLAEVRKLFQQQLRDERKDLVPAVQKKLSGEQIEAVTNKIEAKLAQAEEEKQAEADARRAAARAKDELEKADEARKQAAAEVGATTRRAAKEVGNSAANVVETTKRGAKDLGNSAADVVEATRRSARDLGNSAAEAAKAGVESVRETSERAVANARNTVDRVRDEASARARKAKADATRTANVYRDTARERGADVKAVGTGLRNFARAGGQVRTIVVESVKRSGRDSLAMGKQVLRNPREFGKAQRDYAAAATRNLLETTNEILTVLRASSAAGRRPIEQRLEAVS